MAPPKARSSVAPGLEDDLDWAELGRAPSGCCCFAPGRACKCCDGSARQHWRLAFTVFSAAFLGMVVYLAINAYNVTQASTGGGSGR
jgi:hypothetical protein